MGRYDLRGLGGSRTPAEYGVYTWDVVADAFRMDATLCRYLGVDESVGAGGISLRKFVTLLYPADRAAFTDAIETSARTGAPFAHSFRLGELDELGEKLQAIGHSFPGVRLLPGVCTGLVVRTGENPRSTEAELVDYCIIAYEFARKTNSTMVQYLISMALVELGYQMARFECGQAQ